MCVPEIASSGSENQKALRLSSEVFVSVALKKKKIIFFTLFTGVE